MSEANSADAEPVTAHSRWARALEGPAGDRREALRELAASYSYCVFAWWRRAGLDAADASTATVASFTRWLGEAPPSPTDSGAARLREWLLARLAELAGEGVELEGDGAITFDLAWAEGCYADEPPGAADAIFQRRWTITIVEFTIANLRAEYAARGEQALFDELIGFAGFTPSDDERYAAAAARQGCSSGAMRKAVFDFRTRQRETLRAFAADTVQLPADVDSEITALFCAWEMPSPDAAASPLPAGLGVLNPDEVLARAMQSVHMSKSGVLGWTPPSVEEAARLFPQFEVLSLLGRGGMGAVYKARQIQLDRLVAIKLLPLEISMDADFAERFRREARAMAKLSHPNIIAVYGFGSTTEGHLYFFMEYVEGANLHEMIRGPGLAPAQALEIITGVCDALAYAHAKGVVHRDIKPANVMVSHDGEVKVADFGLARLTDPVSAQEGFTQTGTVVGTPDYMAPEQKHGLHVDHRADIYSLGVMLYEMLCRDLPQGIFDLPSKRVPGVTVRCDQVVARAMAQQPERRYQSTLEMKTEVAASRPHGLVRPKFPSGPLPRFSAVPAKPSKFPLLAGGAISLVAAALVAHYFLKSPPLPAVNQASAAPAAAALKVGVDTGAAAAKPALHTTPPIPLVQSDRAHGAATSDKVVPSPPVPEPAAVRQTATVPQTSAAPKIAAVSQPAAPAPAPRSPSETEKWLAQIDGPQQEAYRRLAAQPFEKNLADLRTLYETALDTAITNSSSSGQLAEAVALRAERQSFAQSRNVEPDDSSVSPKVQALRADFRQRLAGFDQKRRTQANLLFASYDAALAKYQTQLTQEQRLDDAVLLDNKRREIARVWLGASPLLAGAPAVASAPKPSPSVSATKEKPFENSLGMRFVPVPIAGSLANARPVYFSIWDTRVQDYGVFANETHREWQKPEFSQAATHPAVMVSWEDAKAFCQWLTERDRVAHKLGANDQYRLPSDHEWSCATGIGEQEDPAKSPAEKDGKIDDAFPWGAQWPPPVNAGNYAGEEVRPRLAAGKYIQWIKEVLSGYNDHQIETSPVGTFPANRFGLFDLGGNVWQWCDDWFDKSHTDHVLRGASWGNGERFNLLSSHRSHIGMGRRDKWGFRCVLVTVDP